MKSKYYFLTSGLLAACVAVSAQAAGYGESKPGMERMQGEKMGMMKDGSMMMGMHKMTGTVGNIDHAKGVLMLKTGAADMTLHFSPDSIKDLKEGDTITVKLGFSKGMPAATDK